MSAPAQNDGATQGDGHAAGKKFKDLTLVFCRRQLAQGPKEVLLGMKKRGFGAGKWNGFGGKVEPGETVEQAASRELLEESCVKANGLLRRGRLIFTVPSYPHVMELLEESCVKANGLLRRGRLVFAVPSYPHVMRVHVFEADGYTGTPQETEEMLPRWYEEQSLPFQDMWADDPFWLPLFLAGKMFEGEFDFKDDDTIHTHTLREVAKLQAEDA